MCFYFAPKCRQKSSSNCLYRYRQSACDCLYIETHFRRVLVDQFSKFQKMSSPMNPQNQHVFEAQAASTQTILGLESSNFLRRAYLVELCIEIDSTSKNQEFLWFFRGFLTISPCKGIHRNKAKILEYGMWKQCQCKVPSKNALLRKFEPSTSNIDRVMAS